MGEPSYSLGTFFLCAPKDDLEESPQGTFFQSKHFRGIFNTSRSFSQKAAFLLHANSFAIQLLQKVYMNNLAVAVALLRLVDLSSDILCLERACSQSVRLDYPWLRQSDV